MLNSIKSRHGTVILGCPVWNRRRTSRDVSYTNEARTAVTCCTECGFPGYNIRVANGRCSKTVGEERCSGVNAIAANKADWIECKHCQVTGYYRNKECPKCKGTGYLFRMPAG
jgi:hypothetical protein